MAALPYIQLYPADYLADTMHLTAEEHGAYLLLLMNYWQTGKPLPDNDSRLANIARVSNERWTDVKQALMEFFIRDGDLLKQPRIEADLEAVRVKQEKAAAAGKASAKARKQRNETKNKHRGNVCLTSVVTDVTTEGQPESNHIDPDPDPDIDNKKTKAKKDSSADASTSSEKKTVDNTIAREVVIYFNDVTGKTFKQVESHHKLIRARLAEGHTIDDIKTVIHMKHQEWSNDKRMAEYVNPGTIFKASNFNKYAGHVPEFLAGELGQGGMDYSKDLEGFEQ